jgi:hypothetical protein
MTSRQHGDGFQSKRAIDASKAAAAQMLQIRKPILWPEAELMIFMNHVNRLIRIYSPAVI